MPSAAAAVRRRAVHVISTVILAVLVLIALVLVAVMVVSNTTWGREQVRVRVVSLLDEQLAGQFHIRRLEGNLLTGVRLLDVQIADTTGMHFLSADTLSTEFRLLSLIRQRIQLHDVRIVHPLVVLDQSPVDQQWNWARIFMGDTTARDTASTGPGWGDWISLESVELVRGQLVVRMPWTPDSALEGAARDSAITVALADSSRARVEEVPGGFQTIYDFQQLSALLPLLRVADPEFEIQQYEIERLTTLAYPFRPPPVVVENFAGTLLVSGDSLWFDDAVVQLPGTRAIADMRVGLGDATDLMLLMHADTVSLADLQFLYPPLPQRGGGEMALTLTMRNDSTSILARDLQLAIDDSRTTGRVGVVLVDDTLSFTDTDLSTQELPTELIESLLPGLEFPVRGSISGTARLEGPARALLVDADLSFAEDDRQTSRIIANGELGMPGDGVFRAEGLQLEMRTVQVSLAESMMPDLPVGGELNGTATV